MSILSKIFGDPNEKAIKELAPLVEDINLLEKEMEKLTGEELREKTKEFKKELANGAELDAVLPRAYAAAREVAKRTLGQRHFDVQIMGGIALNRGEIAEMKTGEGKTLVATLPVYLNALAGKGAHVVTVNDYLARRDAVWMGQIYFALGLSVGCINHEASYLYDPAHGQNSKFQIPNSKQTPNPNDQKSKLDEKRDILGGFQVVHEFLRPVSRKDAYAADITYGTNNEFGFDYLRDNMAYSSEQMVQRGHNFAIVDEVDSILIDEARTPLIISAPDAESGELYKTFAKIVPRLKENEDYNIDEKMKAATLTEAGIEKVENILGVGDIYTEKGIRYVHHLEQALRAQALFMRDRDYVVKQGEVIIVDEFTGRLMPGRRWSEGLHQAIEAKEGVEVQRESRTLATITFQNYFRLYDVLSGMTGTAATSAEEFSKVYGLEVVKIPTNQPLIRQDLPDKVFQTGNGKWRALAREIKERSQKGQPVLIGTVSIEKNEKLSRLLKKEGVEHKILNAKHHEEEGFIIAQAGRPGAVTVATNMAGRGVDIILGGNPPEPEDAKRVKEAGGLAVIGTERHEARRIDDQLRGRAGRQGDAGMSQFFVSMEDDLMRVFGSDKIKNLMGSFGIPEDEPIENKMVSRALESAQQKIEGFNFDARKHVLEYDNVMTKQREALYGKRKKILFAGEEELQDLALDIIEEQVSFMVGAHTEGKVPEDWNREEMKENIKSMLGEVKDEVKLNEAIQRAKMEDELKNSLFELAEESFAEKTSAEGAKEFLEGARGTMLRAIDALWVEHLEAMDYMRSSVRLRAYGQRDPLIEYKNEGARMFQTLLANIDGYIANLIFKVGAKHQGHTHVERDGSGKQKFVYHSAESALAAKVVPPAKSEAGRNDPCPCGAINTATGKIYKYKNCGLINAPHHKH